MDRRAGDFDRRDSMMNRRVENRGDYRTNDERNDFDRRGQRSVHDRLESFDDNGYDDQQIDVDRNFNHIDRSFNDDTYQDRVVEESEEGYLFFQDCIMKPPNDPELTKNMNNQMMKKPNGCKSIILTRLPDIAMQDVQRMQEIFTDIFTTNGGDLDFCRVRHNYRCCEIRFMSKESINLAKLVNGYTVIVKHRHDGSKTIRFQLNINYMAFAGDQNEYQQQRLVADKLGLKGGMLPELMQFNMYNCQKVEKNMKDVGTFISAVHVVRAWLLEGKFNGPNIPKFLTFFDDANGQVKRLEKEELSLKRIMKEKKRDYVQSLKPILKDAKQLEMLFNDLEKFWNKLGPKQKKYLGQWINQIRDFRREMEKLTEDTEREVNSKDGSWKRNAEENNQSKEELKKSKQQIETLQQKLWQLTKDSQQAKDEAAASKQQLVQMTRERDELKQEKEERTAKKAIMLGKRRRYNFDQEVVSAEIDTVQARIMCMLSSYLRCYPNGAPLTSLEEYLRSQQVMFDAGEIDKVLLKFPQIFCMFYQNKNGKNQKMYNLVVTRR